jgi:hypothetical protein
MEGVGIPLICSMVAVVTLAAPPPQVPQQARATSFLAGRVIDGTTKQPVGGVPVYAWGIPAYSQAPSKDEGELVMGLDSTYSGEVVSDANGRFVFESIPAGAYVLNHSEHWTPVGDGQRVTAADVVLWPLSTISGRVLDERGQPAINVPIVVVPIDPTPYDLGWIPTVTDDRGMFAVSRPAGTYMLAAMPSPVTRPSTLRAPNREGQPAIFQTTFYGQTPSANGASRISVGPGEERGGVDVVLRSTPIRRVTGIAEGVNDPLGVSVQLLRPNPLVESVEQAIGSTSVDAQGRFAFSNVPASAYRVRARRLPELPYASHAIAALRSLPDAPTIWAEETITVVDRDIELRLALRTGARVTGRVEFDGSSQRPSSEQLLQRALVIQGLGQPDARFLGTYLPDDRFSTIQLAPGRYQFRPLEPKSWYVRSVVVGGRDVRDVALDLGDHDVVDGVITFTDRVATIAGRVRREPPFETTRGSVAIFPTDRTMWPEAGSAPRRVVSVILGTSGVFEAAVPPGSYFVVAIAGDIPGGLWTVALEQMSRVATPVAVGDGQRVNQELRFQRISR